MYSWVMHEFLVAGGVVESLVKYVSESGRVVKSFRVVVGELSMLDIETLSNAIKTLITQTALRNAVFTVEVEPASIVCGTCLSKMSFNEAMAGLNTDAKEVIHFIPDLVGCYISCVKCGSVDLKVVSGRWVEVRDVVT
uniref:Hydrogenase nickel incorporation protein HypA n=1 Tax=Caldiarchaeum subterraneum TaxID=311458 RepID=A0A7C5Y8S0_CALS0